MVMPRISVGAVGPACVSPRALRHRGRSMFVERTLALFVCRWHISRSGDGFESAEAYKRAGYAHSIVCREAKRREAVKHTARATSTQSATLPRCESVSAHAYEDGRNTRTRSVVSYSNSAGPITGAAEQRAHVIAAASANTFTDNSVQRAASTDVVRFLRSTSK